MLGMRHLTAEASIMWDHKLSSLDKFKDPTKTESLQDKLKQAKLGGQKELFKTKDYGGTKGGKTPKVTKDIKGSGKLTGLENDDD